MNEWLDQARSDLSKTVGDYRAAYELSPDDVREILELARVAAHESGERATAPLTAYLVGLARGRHPDYSLADLVAAIVERPSGGHA